MIAPFKLKDLVNSINITRRKWRVTVVPQSEAAHNRNVLMIRNTAQDISFRSQRYYSLVHKSFAFRHYKYNAPLVILGYQDYSCGLNADASCGSLMVMPREFYSLNLDKIPALGSIIELSTSELPLCRTYASYLKLIQSVPQLT
jgi:hypothetical protein